MITHQIVKHKPRLKITEAISKIVSHLPVIHTPVTQQQKPVLNFDGGVPLYGKREYMEILKGLRLHVGDYCFFKNSTYPIEDDCIYKVEAIQEIHYLVTGNNFRDKSPKPYHLINRKGGRMEGNDELLVNFLMPEDRKF